MRLQLFSAMGEIGRWKRKRNKHRMSGKLKRQKQKRKGVEGGLGWGEAG